MKRISCKKQGVPTVLPGNSCTLSTALPYCILEPLTELELCILNIHTKFLLFSIKVKFICFLPDVQTKAHVFNIIDGLEGPPNERGKYVLSGPPPPTPKLPLKLQS